MEKIDTKLNLETLDSLRTIRQRLYSIPGSELSAMSLDDQVKYGDSVHQFGTAILKLEAAKLKGVNDRFKEREEELKTAAVKLEKDTNALIDTIKIVRVVDDGIGLIANIVKLLA